MFVQILFFVLFIIILFLLSLQYILLLSSIIQIPKYQTQSYRIFNIINKLNIMNDLNIIKKEYKFQDFQILQTLDSTHGGSTQLYVIKHENKIMVCKSIAKSSFLDEKSVTHIKNQKQCLKHFTQLKHNGINHIIDTFQDTLNLYMLLQLVQGLALHKLLKMTGNLSGEMTRLVVSQVGLIMLDFHQSGYIYRDIKASNFLINSNGKVTMIDLGKAKHIKNQRTFTICGTNHSIPPQIYDKQGYSYEFDYYSFGVLIYQLLAGQPPFGYQSFSQDYLQKVRQGLNQNILSKIQCLITKDLIKVLMSNKNQRLGKNGGFQQILQHQYFNNIQFLTFKDILNGEQVIDKKDQRYQLYLSEIQDFGLQFTKYSQISQNDPFFKFCQ